MHEASRRLLGVLLREIDGFNHRDTAGSSSDGGGGDSSKRSVVIGATNRQQDLDAALLSRCGSVLFLFAVVQDAWIQLCVHPLTAVRSLECPQHIVCCCAVGILP